MAITLPSYYKFAQNRLASVYNENIVEDTLLVLRDNNHYLYANHNIRTSVALYWPAGIKTTSITAEQILNFHFRFNLGRNNTGIRFIIGRTGVCTVTIVLRDADDTVTIDSFSGTAGAGDSSIAFTDFIDDQDILIKVYLTVTSPNNEGLYYLLATELPLDLTNLPG